MFEGGSSRAKLEALIYNSYPGVSRRRDAKLLLMDARLIFRQHASEPSALSFSRKMVGLTAEKTIRYSRSRFFTRLPEDRLYTPSHYWLSQRESDTWCVGFTKFATRMLGELVEFDFEVAAEAEVKPGQVIGWVEGFKAVTDVYCCATGSFVGSNPALSENIELMNSDPYKTGWLYEICGTPSDDCMDLTGYVALLDITIDKMTGKTV